MPRYTDIDLLIDKVEGTDWYHISKQGELVRGANSKDDIPLYKHSDIKEVLNDAPVADVAPKSEVAREIFEEIEIVLHRHYHDNKITLEDSGLLIVSKHSAHHSIAVLLKDISELKKKYTEDE